MVLIIKQNDKEDELPAIFDINTENEHFRFNENNLTPNKRDRRQDYNQLEFAPLLQQHHTITTRNDRERLLQDIDSNSDDEELASPPIVTSKNNRKCLIFNNERYCFCFHTRKTCLFVCLISFVIPLVSFTIFASIYFSPVSLPNIPTTITSNNQLSNHQDSTAAIVNKSTTISPRLLTFNMFMRPPGVKNNENDFKNERLDYIIKNVLPLHDIITIQEAFAYANRRIDQLLVAAFGQGFYYHVGSPRHYPWDLGGDGGLLILSRYPIKKADRIEFSRGVHADWLSFKGALHALIELDDDKFIHVYTTHTQASYDNGGKLNLDDTKVRLSQFADVHQFIQDTAQNDTFPILLMGDLNVDAAIHNGSSPDVPSYQSSLAYTMMMDVLTGKGTNLKLIGGDDTNDELSFTSSWRLDNLTDIPYKSFGYHPVTFGDYKKSSNGTLIPAETILTSHNQLLTVQSIDRLLWIGDRSQNNTMTLSNITVERFYVPENASYPFTQISDHYGLGAILHTQ